MTRALDASSAYGNTGKVYEYTATTSQTVFTGTDKNGYVLSYDPAYVMVVKNGFVLQKEDFTATSGTSVTIAAACALGDSINIFSFTLYLLADMYTTTQADAQFATKSEIAPGAVGHFAMNTAPTGWLKANGAAVLIATYPNLAANIYCGDANNPTALFGYKCTDATGTTRSTTGTYIVLPDMRGEFVRAWDDSRGIDASRAFGTAQTDEFKQHDHAVWVWTVGAGGGSGNLVSTSSGTSSFGLNNDSAGVRKSGTAAETRPRNISLLACIKY